MEAYAESKSVQLKLVVDAKVFIRGDELLLGQGISNLLKNAIEFSPEGGCVEIRLSEETEEATRWACIRVRDYGSGVPEYALGKVFDRFFSLPRPATGTKSSGLGLSIVKSIAELHLGTITLVNGPERGATATLRIPSNKT